MSAQNYVHDTPCRECGNLRHHEIDCSHIEDRANNTVLWEDGDYLTTGDYLSVCQHPNGDRSYVDGVHPTTGCFEGGCDCTPRVYVAVDAIPRALQRAHRGE